MNTTHPPVGPTEAEVREHFANQLPPDAKLMRPAYTSIWALEDGTLLWDWKEGFATLGSKLKTVIYLTREQGSGKSTLVSLMRNAVEIQAPADGPGFEIAIAANPDVECIVFTDQIFSLETYNHLLRITKDIKLIWLRAN